MPASSEYMPTWLMCAVTTGTLVLTSFAAGYYMRELTTKQQCRDNNTCPNQDDAQMNEDDETTSLRKDDDKVLCEEIG